MRVAIGSDHAGAALKTALVDLLRELVIGHHDFGTFDTQAADYPDVAHAVAGAVAGGEYDRGIIICGTGIGASIAANKVRGIRAALCHDTFSARMSRAHNDANVLCMGGRIIGPGLAVEIVREWLATPFSGEERHARRIGKIARIEGEP